MKAPIVDKSEPLLLVGGGECHKVALIEGLSAGMPVVAADGGARVILDHGALPEAVIGDIDSLSPKDAARLPEGRLHRIAEQDSTDFDKCLRHVSAPLIVAHGFLGARLDHQLAALTVLARHAHRAVVLVGPCDVVAICPPTLSLPLQAGCRVSLWPLAPVLGRSEGLRWPIDGLRFAPDGQVGTSNEALGPVRLEMEAPAMLLMLPVAHRALLVQAVAEARRWPAP